MIGGRHRLAGHDGLSSRVIGRCGARDAPLHGAEKLLFADVGDLSVWDQRPGTEMGSSLLTHLGRATARRQRLSLLKS